MNHKPYLDWIHMALDEPLASEQRAQLDEHLAACADCQATWAALNEAERLFKAEALAAPRAGFTSRFRARLAAERRRSRPRALGGALALALGAVGSAALVLPAGLGLLISVLRVAQQPATTAAFYSGFNAAAAFAYAILEALFITARALIGWAMVNPLTWVAGAVGLGATGAWLYCMRKLVAEVSFR